MNEDLKDGRLLAVGEGWRLTVTTHRCNRKFSAGFRGTCIHGQRPRPPDGDVRRRRRRRVLARDPTSRSRLPRARPPLLYALAASRRRSVARLLARSAGPVRVQRLPGRRRRPAAGRPGRRLPRLRRSPSRRQRVQQPHVAARLPPTVDQLHLLDRQPRRAALSRLPHRLPVGPHRKRAQYVQSAQLSGRAAQSESAHAAADFVWGTLIRFHAGTWIARIYSWALDILLPTNSSVRASWLTLIWRN